MPASHLYSNLPNFYQISGRLGFDTSAYFGGSLDIDAFVRNLTNISYPSEAIVNLPESDRSVLWNEPGERSASRRLYRF